MENIDHKTELVSLLEKENFELGGQLIDKPLIIKQLKIDSKSNPFPTDISTTTNTTTKPTQTNDNINSNNNNNKNNNNMTTSTTITITTRTMTTTTTIKRTIIALMKKQFTTKSYKYSWRKFEK